MARHALGLGGNFSRDLTLGVRNDYAVSGLYIYIYVSGQHMTGTEAGVTHSDLTGISAAMS